MDNQLDKIQSQVNTLATEQAVMKTELSNVASDVDEIKKDVKCLDKKVTDICLNHATAKGRMREQIQAVDARTTYADWFWRGMVMLIFAGLISKFFNLW